MPVQQIAIQMQKPADFARYSSQKSPVTREKCLQIMARKQGNLFITGKAGSGKSTLVAQFVEQYGSKLNIAVLAPTGIAALNIGGQTIHSFFLINYSDPSDTSLLTKVHKWTNFGVFKKLDVLIIDEISMVSAELFSEIGRRLKIVRQSMRPFGGVKTIVVGDYRQLPPVETTDQPAKYAFMSSEYDALGFETIKLLRDFRQKDESFLHALNCIRTCENLSQALLTLNVRTMADSIDDASIILTTTNAHARMINQSKLEKLPGSAVSYSAKLTGKFEDKAGKPNELPTDEVLSLKVGARVMFIKNDPEGRWVNGSIGTVARLGQDAPIILLDGQEFEASPASWKMTKHSYDKKTETISKVTIGEFSQVPLKLAWAATIHKCQGQTFERCTVDFSAKAPWAFGQAYVALSRVKTIEGLRLARPIFEGDIIADKRIDAFESKFGI